MIWYQIIPWTMLLNTSSQCEFSIIQFLNLRKCVRHGNWYLNLKKNVITELNTDEPLNKPPNYQQLLLGSHPHHIHSQPSMLKEGPHSSASKHNKIMHRTEKTRYWLYKPDLMTASYASYTKKLETKQILRLKGEHAPHSSIKHSSNFFHWRKSWRLFLNK